VEGTYFDGKKLAMITFCFDHMSAPGVLGYPNLAQLDLEPDEFDFTWPRTVPLRLQMYLKKAQIPFRSCHVEDAPRGSWYPVALGWHDFSCDYFSLMSDSVKRSVKKSALKILFYYHEGDDPAKIKRRLDSLCDAHQFPPDCYLFVSANSAAENLDNFFFFQDHEYFFRYVNRTQAADPVNGSQRDFRFTALNRTHKWWRAYVMSDLYHSKILDQSLWSYNTQCQIDDLESENPIETWYRENWKDDTYRFLENGPYVCDTGTVDSHNDHRRIEDSLYKKSYCHLVLETLFDADGSGGSFITEKTYKCLKYGQPFVIIGTPGSLARLRERGYRTFDHAIDNSYDTIQNNTQRWLAVKKAIGDVNQQNMQEWFQTCLLDIKHNQELFKNWTCSRLLELKEKLQCNHW
jgi:hypothetical protein